MKFGLHATGNPPLPLPALLTKVVHDVAAHFAPSVIKFPARLEISLQFSDPDQRVLKCTDDIQRHGFSVAALSNLFNVIAHDAIKHHGVFGNGKVSLSNQWKICLLLLCTS